jgi:transketolase
LFLSYVSEPTMSVSTTNIKQLAIDTIRTLSMDAVQTANSGHPGTPMALAPVAHQIWTEAMRYDPAAPLWPNRDRFVLSCGHASMLLYSLLHLMQVKGVGADQQVLDELAIKLDDIKNFRQVGSPCAGHPEFGDAAGIETTTGPLGQGVGNSVGMALASKWLAATYNTDQFPLFDFNTYALCSDGDLMEGVGNEAASLAGHLQLDNLCWIYDDNHITIEGDTELAFSEDVETRFRGLGWHVVKVEDANDLDALTQALQSFQQTSGQPTLIIVRSIIGWGAPNKANTHGAHGAPLGWDEIEATKEFYGWPKDANFHVPEGVVEHFADTVGQRGSRLRAEWQARWEGYQRAEPAKAAELEAMFAGRLPEGWDKDLPTFEASEKGDATRNSSGKALNAVAKNIPFMIGGSADLAPSTKTLLNFADVGSFAADHSSGRNLHFGVREHAMAAICNGLSLCGLRAYGATFFVFTDYMRGGMRLSSIMHQPVLYVLTHDSIGVGEDGPTHQPIEHLAACRAIPGLNVFRPGDANEVSECYRTILQIDNEPAALVCSRQAMPTLDRDKYAAASGTQRGGYVLGDCEGTPEVIVMGTGSELQFAVAAYERLIAEGVKARVVSMPSLCLFAKQPAEYREEVLPAACGARVAVEAGVSMPWYPWIGSEGAFVGMETFGASGPFAAVYEKFGIDAEAVYAAAKELLA